MSLHLLRAATDTSLALSREESAARRLTLPLACDEALRAANESEEGQRALALLQHCSEVTEALVVPSGVDLFTLRPVLDPPPEPEALPVVRLASNLAEAGAELTAAQKAALRHYTRARLDHLKAWVRRGVVGYSAAPEFNVEGDDLLSDELVEAIADRGEVLVELVHHLRNLSELSELGKAR